jgi:tetraacyldisaccharide 4'-kinase
MATRLYQKKSIQKIILSVLLSPLSLLYGIGVSFRNMLYDGEILKPSVFSVPLIGVGNLSIGGAGKTPHIEYLIKILQPYINVATLSRGYNRNTSGFRFVVPSDTALTSGDEPLMYARKFEGMPVAVCENRAIAVPQMIQRYPQIQTILLDDAFQHRSVQPFINILLTQYELPYNNDFLMPSGRLREWRSSYKRADIIIVTKCPNTLNLAEKEEMVKSLNLKSNQKVFFSKYKYSDIYHFYNPTYRMKISNDHDIIMISAIANTNYLVQYLEETAKSFTNLQYTDHHNFDSDDIGAIIQTFKQKNTKVKYILTTEKDAVRLLLFRDRLYENEIPIFVLPIEVEILFDEKEQFDQLIKTKLMAFEA